MGGNRGRSPISNFHRFLFLFPVGEQEIDLGENHCFQIPLDEAVLG